jgi:hypothetical protein
VLAVIRLWSDLANQHAGMTAGRRVRDTGEPQPARNPPTPRMPTWKNAYIVGNLDTMCIQAIYQTTH